jgi:mono/diheme cytochrome c family protein
MHQRQTPVLRLSFLLSLLLAIGASACIHRHPTETRVPRAYLNDAQSLKAPFGDAHAASPEIVAEGKKLFEGKGSCAHCHGVSGAGNGPASHMHGAHPPRDFTDCAFQQARTDGELYWVVDYGIPGTGMVDHVHDGSLSPEQAWKIVAYLRTFCTSR